MIKNLMGPALLLALFFINTAIASPLKVGVIDTGFCLDQMPKGIVVKSPLLAAGKLQVDPCKLSKEHPRLHGQLVLEHFLAVLGKQVQVEIHPMVVFNDLGKQELKFWKEALIYAKKLDVLIIAAGFPYYKRLSGLPGLETFSFIASGTREGGIKTNTTLFPQELAPNEKIILIGSYSPSVGKDDAMVDSRRMYRENIDYYFPGDHGKELLTGSSRAVAEAAGLALRHCPLKEMKKCLASRKRFIKVINQKEALPTF